MAVTSQPQPELIFDTESARLAFGFVLDGVLCYVKSSGIHYVYDVILGGWKIINATSNICVQISDKVITNTMVETSLLGTLTKTNVLPIGFLGVGRDIFIKVQGFHSMASLGGNIGIRIKLNSKVILTTGSINSGAASSDGFEINANLTIRTVGTSGTIIGQGVFINRGTGNAFQMRRLVPVTINTEIAQTIDVTWQYASANSGNIVTSTNAKINI